MDLEVRHLRLVAALSETGNMTRAASRLHLTQSALSHQLRDVEDRLGARLFDRESKTMRPTAAGRRLLETARRVLAELESAEKELRDGLEPRETLRLSTECYTCYHWLPDLLIAYRRQHPMVDVQIVAGATRDPFPSLLEGELDLAIVSERIRNNRVGYRPLFADELVAVMPPSHPLTRKPFLVAQDFAEEHLILYDAPKAELTIFSDVLFPAAVSPKQASHVQLTEAIIEMVKAGLGIGILARWAVLPHTKAGTLVAVPVTRRGLQRRWQAAFTKKKVLPAHITDFIGLMAAKSFPALYRGTRRGVSAMERSA
jgi:LysR family transcriptional regulator for metE and metH